jgi:hypothetical protein
MALTNSNNNNTPITGKFFTCPIENCNHQINGNYRQIAEHIKNFHSHVAKNMGLQTNPNKSVFICKSCNVYTSSIHYHCFECEHPENGGKLCYFKTSAERDAHLKNSHTKWWLELECKHGLNCRGKNGGCGFNHNHFDQPYVTDIINIPKYVCRYERPWEGTRCLRDKCSYSHFWGRVRHLIKNREKNLTLSNCADCESYSS